MEEQFENYEVQKLFRSFVTLQAVMIEVMKNKGGNEYTLPHLHKDRHQNEGRLAIFLSCDARLVAETKALIEEGERERSEGMREGEE